MKYSGKANEAAARIVDMFKSGNVPQALSQVFIVRPNDGRPSTKWSYCNRFLMIINGTMDARGFRQWQDAGRSVKKGSKAFHILGPNTITKHETTDTGEKTTRTFVSGFHSVPVFRFEDTEGADLPGMPEDRHIVNSLPFVEVARAWGIEVSTYNGENAIALGWFAPGHIALGTHNRSTWAHELIHAAESKLGTLKRNKTAEEKKNAEIVAELGGAVLLSMIGQEQEADIGGCWQYVEAWTGGKDTIGACMALINRVCAAVNLIMEESDKLATATA